MEANSSRMIYHLVLRPDRSERLSSCTVKEIALWRPISIAIDVSVQHLEEAITTKYFHNVISFALVSKRAPPDLEITPAPARPLGPVSFPGLAHASDVALSRDDRAVVVRWPVRHRLRCAHTRESVAQTTDQIRDIKN